MTRLQQRWAITAVAVVLVMAAGWFFLLSPQRSHTTELRGQALAAQQANDSLRAAVAELSSREKLLATKKRQLAEISARLPGTLDLPGLITSLTAAAKTAGVQLLSIAPGAATAVTPTAAAVVPGATPAPSDSVPTPAPGVPPVTSAGPGGLTLSAVPVTLLTGGGFFQSEQFLSALSELPRSFLVTGVSIAAPAPGAASAAPAAGTPAAGQLQVTITGSVFMLTDPAASAPVTPTPAASPAAS